jgi:hypothetical protein
MALVEGCHVKKTTEKAASKSRLSTPTAWSALKDKQRAIRAGFPDSLGLRVHRALSWLGRAEGEKADEDVRFMLLWIGFNAAYARDIGSELDEQRSFKKYLDTLVSLDGDRRIHHAVWERFPHEIRVLLNNKYVFGPFFKHHNGLDGYNDWAERFVRKRRRVARCLAQFDTSGILSIVFDRLYVLRNQLVHGGATWNSSVNRDQVRDGAAILGRLLPLFIDIMMDNPKRDWGRPFYPVVD